MYRKILFSFLVLAAFAGGTSYVSAAVSSWQQGVTVAPHEAGGADFASTQLRESLTNLKATGADYVAFMVPYYQTNLQSNELHPGWNTPSDEKIVAAIRTAKSLGFKVMLKIHAESETGDWRANITPTNKTAWFASYGGYVSRVAEIAQVEGVEMVSIGTEMVKLTSTKSDPGNTAYWVNLIAHLRTKYSGKLTYGANSTYYSADNEFSNEKIYVGFWDKLDYVSLSPYYSLDYGSNDVETLKRAWDWWNTYDIGPFYNRVQKPILFGELGYRSLEGAYRDPWNWQRTGAVDEQGQANDYEALFAYWNNYSYMQGVYLWNWSANPNAGGAGNTDYTPQGKKAEAVMKKWWGGTVATPAAEPAFTVTAGTASGATVGNRMTLPITVANSGGGVNGAIVDLEVYAADSRRVHQEYMEGQSFASQGAREYTLAWTPAAAGTYTVKVGVFASGWSKVYHWNDRVKTITVAGAAATPELLVQHPVDGAALSGLQVFRASYAGRDPGTYDIFWQVDGDVLNPMITNGTADGKEAYVDVSGWSWRGNGPYRLTFTAKDKTGAALGVKDVTISINR